MGINLKAVALPPPGTAARRLTLIYRRQFATPISFWEAHQSRETRSRRLITREGRSFAAPGLPAAWIALTVAVVCLAAGCGASSSPVAPPSEPTVRSSPFYFHADVVTGQVTALEPGDALHRRAADGTVTDIPLAAIDIAGPACVANGAGTVCYVKDATHARVRQVRLTGADPTKAASWTVEDLTKGGTGYLDGSGASARFNFDDQGMDLDPSGSLWVVDNNNNCIRRIDRLAGA